MDIVYKFTISIGVVSTIILIFGLTEALISQNSSGILTLAIGFILMFISYSIYKVAAHIESQNTYFKNRISDLEKQIEKLKVGQ
ncbi:hypothetical protein [Aquisalibacillus elongatus]|uniref:Uncharacterized protein n=1 Tax=Aquisalibacillus elongatus TaxID=485577 RepID=A0A3N5BRZ9_9BACI|nr:hypothetical protein [Aquisalibacillus elongatus]RPF50272.1 hypothetical protein EDC24_2707 [Aquisalibacillus elongatus]